MLRKISLSQTESNYTELVTLDGVDYILRFLWNERDRHWFLTIRDSAGSDIVTGFKLVSEMSFASHVTDERIFPGILWIGDTTGEDIDPGLRDLGTRCLMIYVDEDDLS